MNKGMQIEVIKKLLENQGVSADLKDIEQEIDSTLSLPENIKLIAKKYGLKLTKEQIQEWLNKISEEYEEFKNQELFEEYIKTIIGEDNYMELIEEEEEREVKEEVKEEIAEIRKRVKDEYEAHRQQIKQFIEDLKQRGVLWDYYSSLIAPQIKGDIWHDIRKATLLLLAVSQEKSGQRTRLHMLLYGDPGTGKSEFINWIKNYLGRYIHYDYADGIRISRVGLTLDARGKEPTPGVLIKAHGGLCLLDELDKAKSHDLDALLQAMEAGWFHVSVGKIDEDFEAEVRVIAAANTIDGFSKQLLDRFDFRFELKAPGKDERMKAVDDLVEAFFGERDDEECARELFDFLDYIKPFRPKASQEVKDRIKAVLKAYIDMAKIDLSQLSYRIFEFSVFRIAYAIAKIHMRDVEAEDVVEALKMKDPTLKNNKTIIATLRAIAKGLLKLEDVINTNL